jgi:hypothetical protein
MLTFKSILQDEKNSKEKKKKRASRGFYGCQKNRRQEEHYRVNAVARFCVLVTSLHTTRN